jgi:hypothetical protein
MAMRYCSDGFDTIDAANIMHAARIFATRFAHQKYGPKGRYRTLRLCLDRGVRGASFEALVELPERYSAESLSERHYFTVFVVPEAEHHRSITGRKVSPPTSLP